MAWDFDDQHRAHTNGLEIETGKVTLDTDGTVSVTTRLRTVVSAIATYNSGAIIAGALMCGNVSSNAFTITDSAGAAHSGVVVSYVVHGFV